MKIIFSARKALIQGFRRISARRAPIVAMAVVFGILVLCARPIGHLLILAGNGLPADAQPTCTVPPAVFAGWFASGAVSLDGAVKPANSVAFANTPNCSFYQWAEQMLLWLTSRSGAGRVFNSSTFFDVSPPVAGKRTFIPHTGQIIQMNLRTAQAGPHDLPVIFDRKGRMFEVATSTLSPRGKPLVLNASGTTIAVDRAEFLADGKARFFDSSGKAIRTAKALLRKDLLPLSVVEKVSVGNKAIFLDAVGNQVDVEQGQADGGVLEAQNGSLVFYETMVNDVFAYFLTGTKDGVITPTPAQFPTTQADLDKIVAFAAAHQKTFDDPNALALEIKLSWVEAAGLANPSSYITTDAVIPTYDRSRPDRWIPNGTKTTTLALVGIHIVGSTAGHPEMIWATFEHQANAPSGTFSYINTANKTVTVAQQTAGAWVFCADGADTPFNVQHMDFQNPPDIESTAGRPISPSNTIDWHPWGAASDVAPNPIDVSSAASNTELISINSSVIGQLAAGDVRRNYLLRGATWTIGGAKPGKPFPGGNAVGTSQMANITMETYQQGSSTKFATGVNCFNCHKSNNTAVSHVFGGLQPLF